MSLLQSQKDALEQGAALPEFRLRNVVDGKLYSSGFFTDKKGVLIIFMCNHCPYVQVKLEDVVALQDTFPEIFVVGINANDAEMYPQDGPDHMKELAEKIGLKYYLYDETQRVAKDFGAVCTPDPYFFFDGKLVFHGRLNDAMEPHEAVSENTMEKVIRKALAGNEIEEWFVPSQGCSVKWKR